LDGILDTIKVSFTQMVVIDPIKVVLTHCRLKLHHFVQGGNPPAGK